MERHAQSSTRSPEQLLVSLVYELLDAHDDTARLALGPDTDEDWPAHLDYLRCLQRRGREVLAGVSRD